jgi:hypothetical protein
MVRAHRLVVVLLVLAACSGWSRAQSRPAPFYSLPADGTWVEYEWKQGTPENKEERGTLRISSVGAKEVKGARCRWVEIKVEIRAGEETKWQRRKLLVAEKAFADGKPLADCLLECFHQDDGNRAVVRLSGKRLDEFLGLGLGGAATLREVQAKEEVASKLGKYAARHVSATGKAGEVTREYHAWVTKEVPFGIARVEVRAKGGSGPERAFTAVATQNGRDAKSEVDESAAK